jgi:hypothetical protein
MASTSRQIWGAHFCALIGAALLVCACSTSDPITKSPFARTASDVGGVLAAAATTLDDTYNGKLTFAYASASFVDYRGKIQGIGDKLADLGGAPPDAEITHLQELLSAAQPALDSPCDEIGCDWQGQIDALQRASDGFDQAAKQATGEER